MSADSFKQVVIAFRAVEREIAGVDDEIQRRLAQMLRYKIEIGPKERLLGREVGIRYLGYAGDHAVRRLARAINVAARSSAM